MNLPLFQPGFRRQARTLEWVSPASPLILALCMIVAMVTLSSCFATKNFNKASNIGFLVRDKNTDEPLPGVSIAFFKPEPYYDSLTTNHLGYAEVPKKDVKRYFKDKTGITFTWSLPSARSANATVPSGALALNKYIGLNDLYLEVPGTPHVAADSSQKVADMHYHLSMRAHGLFATKLHFGEKEFISRKPEMQHLNWYKDYKKIKVLQNGCWKKAYVGTKTGQNDQDDSDREKRNAARMKALLDGGWVRPNKTTNPLSHYTQATFPHMKEGNMYLMYNSISPFEHSVANTSKKRFANKNFVTGADFEWLRKIGWKKDTLTHWDNFNLEYKYITSQDTSSNGIGWRFYTPGMDLDQDIPTVIMVVEGGHIFQHKLFPSAINYNISNRTTLPSEDINTKILNHIGPHLSSIIDNPLYDPYSEYLGNLRDFRSAYNVFELKHLKLLDHKERNMARVIRATSRDLNQYLDSLDEAAKDTIVDNLCYLDLAANIDSLKRLGVGYSPVMMVTIGHFAYNGMVGQAIAFDGGKFPNNVVAKKNFGIRVSEDNSYFKQWDGAFYTVPGVTKYGNFAMKRLLDTTGHRILIDLKHSDYVTRDFFYKNLMKKDTIPPICSHCAVNALRGFYYSPLVNEYKLIKAPSTKTFYPFQINLFDEEIKTICMNGGIIGVPLEQRVIGTYINTKRPYPPRGQKLKPRIKIVRLELASDSNSVFVNPLKSYIKNAGHVPDTKLDKVLCQQYLSLEPFLQNVFYILDHAGVGFDSEKGIDSAWYNLCLGSDLDGLIDPVDICPTVSQYPSFKDKLIQFVPFFLALRKKLEPNLTHRTQDAYFKNGDSLRIAFDYLFYSSLKDFTEKYFK